MVVFNLWLSVVYSQLKGHYNIIWYKIQGIGERRWRVLFILECFKPCRNTIWTLTIFKFKLIIRCYMLKIHRLENSKIIFKNWHHHLTNFLQCALLFLKERIQYDFDYWCCLTYDGFTNICLNLPTKQA